MLVLARSSTAAQLDRIAHGCRAARSLQAAQHRSMRRELRWWYADDGSLVIRGRMAPEEGSVVVAALEAAMDTLLKSTAAGDGSGANDDRDRDDGVHHESDADSAHVDGAHSADSDNNDRDAPGLDGSRDVHATTTTDLHGVRPDRGTDSSAEGSSGPAHASTDAGSPGARRAGEETSCSSAVALRLHPRRRAALAADALVLLAETQLAHTPGFVNGGDKYRVIVHVDAASLAATTDAPEAGDSRLSLADQPRPNGLDDGPPLHPQTVRRLACEAAVVGLLRDVSGEILDVGDATRFPSAATARAVRIRDGGACAAPGCSTRHGLQIHHAKHWAHGGESRLRNLVLLCRFHHWLMHEGGFSVTPATTRGFRFSGPDGYPVPRSPALPGDRDDQDDHDDQGERDDKGGDRNGWNAARPAEHDRLAHADQSFGPNVLTPPWWNGDPLDLDYAVGVILDAQDRRRMRPAA